MKASSRCFLAIKSSSRRRLFTTSSCSEGTKKRVLSGIQPTGRIHLGNYAGALKQWVDNQYKFDNYFCVVDLHAITNGHDKDSLRRNTLEAAAMYVASGIDPKESCIFIQSQVPAHSELAWLLNCITPMNWLDRMIQFKEKSTNRSNDAVCVGLYDYPVLMASDILLYHAELVPVGEDQRQHLELARDLCRRFNDQFPLHHDNSEKSCIFKEPEAMVLKEGARLMSLSDATKKMSKSDESDGSRINMLDSADTISKKIKRCKTDNIVGALRFDDANRPECRNLLNIYKSVTGKTQADIEDEVTHLNWGKFKPLLTEAIVEHLNPIQTEYFRIIKEEAYIEKILAEGKQKAALTANNTLRQAKKALGLYVT